MKKPIELLLTGATVVGASLVLGCNNGPKTTVAESDAAAPATREIVGAAKTEVSMKVSGMT